MNFLARAIPSVWGSLFLAVLLTSGCQTVSDSGTTPPPPGPVSQTEANAPLQSASMQSVDDEVIYEDHLIVVTKRFLSGTTAGTELRYRLQVDAKVPVSNVTVTEELPESFEFLNSSPQPTSMQGGFPQWQLGSIDAGASRSVEVSVNPMEVGTFAACSVVTADPRICLPIFVGLPNLTIAKTGTELLEVGETADFEVTVRNTGTATAENVVLEDRLPEGLTATSPLRQNLGSIPPGETRTATFSARATEEGAFQNIAAVSFTGGEEVTANAPVRVERSAIAVTKVGPEESFINTQQPYDITVVNEGSSRLRNVVVTDDLPEEYLKVFATGGGSVADEDGDGTPERLVWNVGDMAPGDERSFRVVLTQIRPGTFDYPVEAVSERGLSDDASVTTRWKAVPGVLTWIVDNVDPIMIGQETVYTAHIQNQSEFEPFTVTQSQIIFGSQVEIVETDRGGTVSGNTVTFEPFELQPGEKTTQQVRVRAVSPGLTTAVMQTMTNFTEVPVQNSETTTVY
ncbi:MAG: CARDB domain-containing protein [Opitutales bacterium]